MGIASALGQWHALAAGANTIRVTAVMHGDEEEMLALNPGAATTAGLNRYRAFSAGSATWDQTATTESAVGNGGSAPPFEARKAELQSRLGRETRFPVVGRLIASGLRPNSFQILGICCTIAAAMASCKPVHRPSGARSE
jgi:hypothetical protein